MSLRPLRTRQMVKNKAENPVRHVLSAIENVGVEPAERKRSSVKADKQFQLVTPSSSRKKLLKLGVSPIGRPDCRALRNTRERSGTAAPVHVVTSTPNSTPSQSVSSVVDPVEHPPCELFCLDPFDTAMESPGMCHTGARTRRRMDRDGSQSPTLTVRKVKRTYSRGSKPASVSINLFEEPAAPEKHDPNEHFGMPEGEHPAKEKKTKPVSKSEALKHQKRDKAFEQWADKMAAEFEEIEKFELCVE